MEFLKQNRYDAATFFTKFPVCYQYIVISQFLLDKHTIELRITPYNAQIVDMVDFEQYEIVWKMPLNPINKEKYDVIYITLIVKAFEHIQKSLF